MVGLLGLYPSAHVLAAGLYMCCSPQTRWSGRMAVAFATVILLQNLWPVLDGFALGAQLAGAVQGL